MPLWESLLQLFQRDAQHLDRPKVRPDHIFPMPTDVANVGIWIQSIILQFMVSDMPGA